jgi:hypothetical protein
MFSTTLAAAAVSGLLASGSLATQPAWQTDYRQALAQATEQQKPVAVFIARGGAGVTRLVSNEGIGADAARLLRQNYVCLYVNTATESGKELAGSFNMTQGVVISDKTGAIQALRHEGTVSQADLTKYLTEQAQTGQTVVQTAVYGAPVQPAAPPTVIYPPQTYQPMYAQPRPLMNAVGNLRNMFGGG